MTSRRSSLPPLPDLSHLTEEERKVIEDVLRRQKEEEEKETEIIRKMQDDFSSYQDTVEKLSQDIKRSGQAVDDGVVCEICHKTKFADGVGHSCDFCQKKACSRCAGRLLGKSAPGKDKANAMWTCNLCKKKQDLLAKSGAWYHRGAAPNGAAVVLDVGNASETSSTKVEASPSSDKRAKLADKQDGPSIGPDKTSVDRPKNAFVRATSLQGKELKRQFSMSDALNRAPAPGRSQGHQSLTSSSTSSLVADRLVPEQHKVKDHAQVGDRGRAQDRGSSKQRFHSESRLSEAEHGADGQMKSERHVTGRRESVRDDRGKSTSRTLRSSKLEDRKAEHDINKCDPDIIEAKHIRRIRPNSSGAKSAFLTVLATQQHHRSSTEGPHQMMRLSGQMSTSSSGSWIVRMPGNQ